MGLLASLLAGAAQSAVNVAAQSTQLPTKKAGGKADCSPCAARALQAGVQKKLNIKKGWYRK